MKTSAHVRNALLCATAVLTASSPVPMTAIAHAQGSRVIDGEPTYEACAALGFHGRYGAHNSGNSQALAAAPITVLQQPQVMAAPAPPPPPPPPVPAAAAAPEDVTVVESLVSTGTLIRGTAENSALPVEVITREELQERGGPTVNDLVRSLSEVGATQGENNRGATGYGNAEANLRGLGSGRTLAVVDGRRIGNSPDATYPGTERYPDAQLNAVKQVETDPVSTFSIDVDTASYSNVRRFLNQGQRPPKESVRVEELVNYFDYQYPIPNSRDVPFSTQVAVAPSPWATGKQLVHIGVQGFKPPTGQEPPLNLVFLVDTSGSMASADRLPLAQRSLNVLVDQLRPQDKVSMVAYAGSAGAVLGPTDGRQKLKIRCAIQALQSGGSTAGGAGLSLAYTLAQENFQQQAVNRVILLTDGDFNVGVTDNKRLEDYVADKRKTGVYLSVYGFGRGNYQDQRMQVLAQNGNGTAAYVDSFEEARKLFRDDFTKSLFPIADDVKIQVEFNPARVAEYRLIGYETRLLRREDFNNDAIDAGEVGAGASVTALYEITPVGGPRAVDPLRYGRETRASAPIAMGELAFLKIRYKPPGGQASRLIERPIDERNAYASLARAPEATRWAAAVAAYGQKLRGDPYVSPEYGWDEILNLAQGARGEDPFGVRTQFVQLARAAKDTTAQR